MLVVTCFKLKAYCCPSSVYSGMIFFPPNALRALSQGLSGFVERTNDPKIAMNAFILNPDSPFFDSPPGFGVMVYDANGEEHGRSEQGFKWALDIEGAVDMTKKMSLFEVNQLTGPDLPSSVRGTAANALCSRVRCLNGQSRDLDDRISRVDH